MKPVKIAGKSRVSKWMVNVPAVLSPMGKRSRRFFNTLADARDFIKTLRNADPLKFYGINKSKTSHEKSQSDYVYVIRVGNFLKIGRSDNLERRMSHYTTHNPDFELVATAEFSKSYPPGCKITGAKIFEQMAHQKFKHLRVKGEWFHYDPGIIEFVLSGKLIPEAFHNAYAKNNHIVD